MANLGQPITIQWARVMAGRIAGVRGNSFKEKIPTKGWWYRFQRRHKEVVLRTPSMIDGGEIYEKCHFVSSMCMSIPILDTVARL